MSTVGNVLWVIFGGVWLALLYTFAGIVFCITIIGIPFGVQAFKLARFSLWPFGRTVVRNPSGGVLELIFNILWLILFGWGIFLVHLAAGAIMCITIIGIPFGLQAFKLSMLGLWPFGRDIVDPDVAAASGQQTYIVVPANPASR
jgi:uncharacterized membrane protein YccF (DUF307 family)